MASATWPWAARASARRTRIRPASGWAGTRARNRRASRSASAHWPSRNTVSWAASCAWGSSRESGKRSMNAR